MVKSLPYLDYFQNTYSKLKTIARLGMYTPNGTVGYPFLKNLTTWVASLLQQSCFILSIHEEVIPVHNRAIHNNFCDFHDPLCVFTVKISYDNCLRDPIYHANVVYSVGFRMRWKVIAAFGSLSESWEPGYSLFN